MRQKQYKLVGAEVLHSAGYFVVGVFKENAGVHEGLPDPIGSGSRAERMTHMPYADEITAGRQRMILREAEHAELASSPPPPGNAKEPPRRPPRDAIGCEEEICLLGFFLSWLATKDPRAA